MGPRRHPYGCPFGGLEFAADSVIDLPALHADWYDWVLGLAPRPGFLADRVVYFHIGQGWRHAPSLPQGPPVRLDLPETTLSLDPARVDDEPTGFRENLPDDAFVLIAPAHDVSGRASVVLTLSSENLPDFDLLVQLYLLHDGLDDATLLAETPFRARHHDLTRPVELILPFISRTTGPGDRFALRVRAPHRRYETNRAARGEVRLGPESSVSIPGRGQARYRGR
ncbi:hypothetical protein [Streptomyces niveus]|uniref:hypothetical protein n=1 Tax=Streptomyces niveus TaxID=193462 RepID=UPI00343E4A35